MIPVCISLQCGFKCVYISTPTSPPPIANASTAAYRQRTYVIANRYSWALFGNVSSTSLTSRKTMHSLPSYPCTSIECIIIYQYNFVVAQVEPLLSGDVGSNPINSISLSWRSIFFMAHSKSDPSPFAGSSFWWHTDDVVGFFFNFRCIHWTNTSYILDKMNRWRKI